MIDPDWTQQHFSTSFKHMDWNTKYLDEAVKALKDLLPHNPQDLKKAGEQKLRLILESMLQKLDVVSREEYEVQTEVLRRTRQRLEELERRLAILEKK